MSSFFKNILFIILMSILIIPVLLIRQDLTTKTEYESEMEFTASYLMLDLYERLSHGEEISLEEKLIWNPGYFEKFSGLVTVSDIKDKTTVFEISVKWPKSEGNYLEISSFRLNTELYNNRYYEDVLNE